MENAPKIDRQAKHVEIYGAVNDLESIICHLDKLINEISETSSVEIAPEFRGNGPEIKGTEPQAPALSDVLNESSDRIMQIINSAHERIERIQELLF